MVENVCSCGENLSPHGENVDPDGENMRSGSETCFLWVKTMRPDGERVNPIVLKPRESAFCKV